MLKIRLKRVGRKHDPSYRIIVTEDFRGPKSGKYIEKVGNYDPRKDTKQIDGERIKYWISKGAQVSDTVHNILVSEKILDGKKKNVVSEKKLAKNKEKKEKAKKDNEPKLEEIETETPKEEKKEEIKTEEPKENLQKEKTLSKEESSDKKKEE